MGADMSKRRHNIKWETMIVLVAGLLAGTAALAQEGGGDGGLQASVGLYFDLNDNLFNSNDQAAESWASRLSPELLLSSAPGSRQLSVAYEGDYAKFFDSPDDDYEDHSLKGRGLFERGAKGLFEISAGFAQGHQARGSGSTQGVPPDSPLFPSEPDFFDRIDWSAEYTHGHREARGRLRFGIGEDSLKHTNNRDRTQYFDRNEILASAGLEIGLRERTAFVFEARYTDTIYDVDRPGQASREGDSLMLLVGVTWEATAKTEGSVRFGSQRRSFDDPVRPAEKSATWDVDVRWLLREHSYFDFVAKRANTETNAGGDFIDRSSYGVSWTHNWAFDLESVLRLDWQKDDYIGTRRKQDESKYYFGLRLPQGNRLIWDTGVSYRDRSTDNEIETLEYEGFLYTIGVNLQLIR